MKKALLALLIGLSVAACPVVYFLVGPELNALQISTLKILLIITACSAAYCFLVGELSGNNSQMDKLWSLLPEVYIWIIAARGGFSFRLIVMAVLATLWGLRLTFNFARKGAYTLKFWAGEEDYRWAVLRQRKEFQPHWKWMLFNLLFISIYQNVLILATTLPALISMNSTRAFGLVDVLAAALMAAFLLLETVSDEQQWVFQTTKHRMLREGKTLEELPEPYNKGFNTTGLWNHSRHPNYLGEQGVWASFYLFSVGAGIGIFNWSLIGALLLIVLFQGSSVFAEEISSSKYPEYPEYCRAVPKFIPGRAYRKTEPVLQETGANP